MKFLGVVILSFILGYAVHYVVGIMVFFAGLFLIMGTLDLSSGKKSKGGKAHAKKATDMSPKVKFEFWILNTGEKAPLNKWYQKKSATNKNFVSYRGDWGSDWKYADEYPGESTIKVAGISHGNRTADFVKLAQSDNFKIYLEDDPTNPVNKNARKIMVSATVDGELVTKHIGYLPDEIANKYAGIELNISPKSAFLPTNENLSVGVEVALLQRSARYLKKKAKEDSDMG